MAIGHLVKSKVAKFDEFYTPREAVEKEVGAYVKADPDVFRGKVVYLPADRTTGKYPSAFWAYFKENFLSLGLRKLVATCYKSVVADDGDPEHGERATLTRSAEGAVVATHTLLEGDGDFRSYEQYSDFLDADVVVTNPPFSRLKDLLEIVTLLDKEFLLVVPLVALNYRRTFQLVWKKRAWFGTDPLMEFLMRTDEGTLTRFGIASLWLTNLYHEAERKPLAEPRTMAENRERAKGKACEQMLYKRYDNYDAIEVSRLEYIPADYQGKIGVPITVLPYIARPLKGVVTEEARAAHREQKFTPSEWELTWKPKHDPFYVWGLVDTQMTRAPRSGSMRDYWGLTLEGKAMFTRIILQYSKEDADNQGSCRGVACYARTSAQSAAMFEERRDADHLFDLHTHTHTIIGISHNHRRSKLLDKQTSRQQTSENIHLVWSSARCGQMRLLTRICEKPHEGCPVRGWQYTTAEPSVPGWQAIRTPRIALRGMAKSCKRV